MFYIVSLFPLSLFYHNPKQFVFYLKLIILVHLYRETGRLLISLVHNHKKIYYGFSEYNSFKNLTRFSVEISAGLSILTFLFYLLSWIGFLSYASVTIYAIRTAAYSFAATGFFIQCFRWFTASRNRRSLGTLRLWQNVFIYIIFFGFITFSLL